MIHPIDSYIDSVKSKQQGTLFVISGPSGVGKGTIVAELLPRLSQLRVSISMTTRPPRNNEQDKVNYFFVSKQAFENKIEHGEFLEYATYNGNYYGTPRGFVMEKIALGEDIILEIEVQGAKQIRENWHDRAVHIFVLPPSQADLESRLRKRSTESPEAIAARLERAKEEISELPDYDYYIINDSLEKAIQDVSAIVLAERLRVVKTNFAEEHSYL